jgi:hypothetical protein
MDGLVQLQTVPVVNATLLLGLDKNGQVWQGSLIRPEDRKSAFKIRWELMEEQRT